MCYRSVEDAADVPLEESLAKLDEQYGRAYYDRSYRGAYLGRALTIHARDIADLYGPPLRADHIAAELDAIYPAALAQDLERLRSLEEEKQDAARIEGRLPDRAGRHHSPSGQGPEARGPSGRDRRVEEEAVRARDSGARLMIAAAAAYIWLRPRSSARAGMPTSKDCSAVLHYAEHNEANLRDAHGVLGNVVSIVTADGRVSAGERSDCCKPAPKCTTPFDISTRTKASTSCSIARCCAG